MSIPREGSRDTGEGIIVSTCPDVCKTPVGPTVVPIPYSIYAKQNDSASATARTVRQTSQESHTLGSLVTTCKGDEPGVAKGVKSGTVGDVCTPKTYSQTVRFEGKNAVRHDDVWWMNNKNTVGKLIYVKDTRTVMSDASPDPVKPGQQYAQLFEMPLVEPLEFAPEIVPEPVAPVPEVAPEPAPVPVGGPKPPVAPEEEEGTGPKPVAEPDDETSPSPKPHPAPQGEDNNRTKKKPCRVGKYKDIKDTCDDGQQAHHIVPDYTLRYGTRVQGIAGDNRIPTTDPDYSGFPSFNDGPAICLDGGAKDNGSEHWEAHGADGIIGDLGSNAPISGTAPMSQIRFYSEMQAKQVRPDCAGQIQEAVDKGFGNTDGQQLGRTTQNPPAVGSPAYNALSQGLRYYQEP